MYIYIYIYLYNTSMFTFTRTVSEKQTMFTTKVNNDLVLYSKTKLHTYIHIILYRPIYI